MFLEIRKSMPLFSAWFECCYGSSPSLLFHNRSILSCTGVQQGDPLGPLGFAIAIHPLLLKLSTINSLHINDYLDDGTLSGDISGILQAIDLIESDGPFIGVSLNRGKCLFYASPNLNLSPDDLLPNIPHTSEGFTLLGLPLVPLLSALLHLQISSPP